MNDIAKTIVSVSNKQRNRNEREKEKIMSKEKPVIGTEHEDKTRLAVGRFP